MFGTGMTGVVAVANMSLLTMSGRQFGDGKVISTRAGRFLR
jgi:hypothetical protein